MKSPVYPLYESAYCFDSADPKLSAVDLIPTEWNRFTVTDGKAFTDETLEALKWRDVYLANTIEEVSGELSDKYIAGAGIEIDKENKTISRVSTKFKLNCSSGLGYNESLNKLIFLELDGSNSNTLIVNNAGELSVQTISPETGTEGKVIKEFTAYLTQDSVNQFPQNCGTVFVTDALCRYNLDKRYGNPNKRLYDWASTEPFDPRIIQPGETINDYTASSYIENFYSSDVEGIEPVEDVVSGLPVSSIHSDEFEPIEFDPSDTTRTYYDETTAIGGKNYITDEINMCPSGVLYIW